MEVIVEYDYIAKEPDELTIRKGDVIKDVIKKQGGWWEGVLKDKKGMFPDNFVKALDKDSSVILRNKNDVSRIRQCRAIFSYNQDHEDELNLNVGDIINIIGEEEEGWWRGILNGKEGVFPSNFVEEIISPASLPKPSIREDTANIPGDSELRVPKLPVKPSRQICEVVFPYDAQNDDELSIKKGDVITLLSKDCQDPGWWKGELNGKSGVFPDNFVTLVSSTDDKNYKDDNKAGAIKPSSIALQRKSLECKTEKINDPNITKTPPLPGKKPSILIKKSPSGSGVGIFTEIKRKIVDVVDGATGSKNIVKSDVSGTKNDSENAFDQIERRSLLTDIRATRAKAPGRRLPSVIHKDGEIPLPNGNAESIYENEHLTSTTELDNAEKRRIREWEKHKAPWLDEMKLNQAKRTSTSPGPESKGKLTYVTDNTTKMEESNLDKSIEKQRDMSKSMPPLELSNSLSETNKQINTNEMEKVSTVRAKTIETSIITNRQSLPLNLKDNYIGNKQISNAAVVLKENSVIKQSKPLQTSPLVTTRNPLSQKPVNDQRSNEMLSSNENYELSYKQLGQLCERLEKLEVIVENQNQVIEDLRNKLQIETDMRIMLQEKILQQL